jgi:predicted ATPase with chaperone activity
MGMTECRSRLRAFWRRRLLRLRDRIDARLERLEQKKAALMEAVAREEEPSPPVRRRPARRRERPARRTPTPVERPG